MRAFSKFPINDTRTSLKHIIVIFDFYSKYLFFPTVSRAAKRRIFFFFKMLQPLCLHLRGDEILIFQIFSQETLSSVAYSEVISTRKVKAESGTLYLELKCGNLFQSRVVRLQTDQAHEIARLIRQYMSLHRRK